MPSSSDFIYGHDYNGFILGPGLVLPARVLSSFCMLAIEDQQEHSVIDNVLPGPWTVAKPFTYTDAGIFGWLQKDPLVHFSISVPRGLL